MLQWNPPLPNQLSYSHFPGPAALSATRPFVVAVLISVALAAVRTSVQADEPGSTPQYIPNPEERLPVDRRAAQQLQDLDELIEAEDGPGFSNQLEQLRLADPSTLIPTGQHTFQPLHRVLTRRLIPLKGTLQGIAAADNQIAQAELRRAVSQNSPELLPGILHRFSGTPTAIRVHLLLARIAADRGQLNSARWWLRPLLDPAATGPLADAARQFDQSLRDSIAPRSNDPADEPSVQETGPGQNLPRLAWIEPLSFPSAIRNSHRNRVRKLEQQQQGLPVMSRMPVMDSERVYAVQPGRLEAWNRSTGAALWTQTLQPDGSPESGYRGSANDELTGVFEHNEIDGSLTADSQRLYVLTTAPSADVSRTPEDSIRIRRILGRMDSGSVNTRELSAFDKLTGKRLWTTGGPPIEEIFGNELAGSWFCGPPLPLGQKLYAVVENPDGQLEAVCLRAGTGELLSRTILVFPDRSIGADPRRQFLRASMQQSHGLLLTSTTTDIVTAVDTLTDSVIWARQLPVHNAPDNLSGNPIRRNISGAISMPFSGPNIPLSIPPLINADEAMWMLAGTPEPEFTDLFTGTSTGRIQGKQLILLWSSSSLAVFAAERAITAWDLASKQQLWSISIRRPGPVPVGQAAKLGDQILIPRSDGSALPVSLTTGRAATPLPGIRSAATAGSFLGDSQGIISYSLNHVTSLTTADQQTGAAEVSLARAIFLHESDQPEAALQMLDQLSDRIQQRTERQRLRYRITLRKVLAQEQLSAELLTQLDAAAATPAEAAIALQLRLADAAARNADDYPDLLLDALQAPLGVLSVGLPDTAQLPHWITRSTYENLLQRPADKVGLENRLRPLGSHLLIALAGLCETINAGETPPAWWEKLSSLPAWLLLRLPAVAVVPELLERVEQDLNDNRLTEVTLHLLAAAEDSIRRYHRLYSDRADLAAVEQLSDQCLNLRQRLRQAPVTADADGLTAMVQQLLQVTSAESEQLSSTIPPQVTLLPQPQPVTLQSADPADWTMFPVITATQVRSRMSAAIEPKLSSTGDPFLAVYEWTANRSSGRFSASSTAVEQDRILSIPTQDPGALSGSVNDRVLRCGSVILHLSSTAITAFSVIDQRLLWTRSVSGTVSAMSDDAAVFTVHDAEQGSSLLNQTDSFRICGYTRRWICLLNNNLLEVRDLLNGDLYWSIDAAGIRTIFAAESCLLLPGSVTGRRHQLDPLTGLALPPSRTSLKSDSGNELWLPRGVRIEGLVRKALRTYDDQLVVWDPEFALDSEIKIQWLNPVTLKVLRQVELPNHAGSQLLDDSTLVSFTQQQEAHLLNLKSAELRSVSYASAAADAEVFRPESTAAAIDLQNLYVFDQVPQPDRRSLPSSLIGLRCQPVEKELRAVSLESGRMAWTLPVKENSYACFDQPASPVLLLVHVEELEQNNPPGQPRFMLPGSDLITVSGIDRRTGITLFEYPIVGHFLMRGLRMNVVDSRQLELDAFGNLGRLLRKPE